MNLRWFYQLAATAVLVLCLHSCDAGSSGIDSETNEELNDRFGLSSRYSAASLAQNAGDIAEMPSNLIDLDVITYDNIIENLTPNNINLPKSDGQTEDWVFSPRSSGVITIERQRYRYEKEGQGASLRLAIDGVSERNNIASIGTITAGLEAIATSGLGREGQSWAVYRPVVAGKFPGEPINAFGFGSFFSLAIDEITRETLAEAIRSLGYVPVVFDDNTPFAEFNTCEIIDLTTGALVEIFIPDVRLFVLSQRVIQHTVTSTNQEILDNGEISGTFQLTDTYNFIWYNAEDEDSVYQIVIGTACGNPRTTDEFEPAAGPPVASGTFVLKLGGLDFTNPNPGVFDPTP